MLSILIVEMALLAVRLLFVAAMILLFVIDLEHRMLPNVVTLPGVTVGLVASIFLEPGWRAAVLGVIVGGGALWAVGEAYATRSPTLSAAH